MQYLRKEQPHWFSAWTGQFCARSCDGLTVGNFDYIFHRFKFPKDKLGQRRIEHLMIVELKTGGEILGNPQRDTLSVANAILDAILPVDGSPIDVKSRPGFIVNGDKKCVWHGIHLLRVPVAPTNVGPFGWDNKWVLPSNVLIDVLNFVRDPRNPFEFLDIDRRHKKSKQLPLLEVRP